MRTLVWLVVAFAGAVASAACTVDASVGAFADGSAGEAGVDAASSDGSNDASSEGSSSGDGGSGDDGSSATEAGPGCGATFAQKGSYVGVEFVQQVLPDGQGGSIVPGTYTLSHYRSYLGGPSGTIQIRSTLLVAGSTPAGTFTFLDEATGTSGSFTSYPPRGRYATYTANASTHAMFLDPSCPSTSHEADRFSATSTELTLDLPSQGLELVYDLVP